MSDELGELQKTGRGWPFIEFTDEGRGDFLDRYRAKCSIQDSSLATEPAIWLGVTDPEVLIRTDAAPRWHKFEWEKHLPRDVIDWLLTGRMHLSIKNVRALLPVLQRFVERGSILPLPEDRQEREVQETWCLSTAHMTHETADKLTHTPDTDMPISVAEHSCGWLVNVVNVEEMQGELEEIFPWPFVCILIEAHQQGYTWVNFDRDGPVMDRLEQHDW